MRVKKEVSYETFIDTLNPCIREIANDPDNEALLRTAHKYEWDVPTKINKPQRICYICKKPIEKIKLKAKFLELVVDEKPICPDCRKDKKIERLRNIQEYKLKQRITKANIPKRYRKARLDTLPQKRVDILNQVDLNDGLWLIGGTRTGKTWMGTAYLIEQARQGSIKFYNFAEMFNSEFDKSKKIIHEAVNFKGCILIDDVRMLTSDYWHEHFDYLLRGRYDNMLPTIYTSNLSEEELMNGLTERIFGRVLEDSYIIRVPRLEMKN